MTPLTASRAMLIFKQALIIARVRYLKTWYLKSIKYLVTLLYYIIQRFWEDGTELKKMWFLYLASRANFFFIFMFCELLYWSLGIFGSLIDFWRFCAHNSIIWYLLLVYSAHKVRLKNNLKVLSKPLNSSLSRPLSFGSFHSKRHFWNQHYANLSNFHSQRAPLLYGF